MMQFDFQYQLEDEIDKLYNHGGESALYDLQHFYFGCCNWLRGFIEYPKVKDAYEKAKLAIGSRSLFVKTPGWRDMDVFRGQRKSCQYVLYNLIAEILEHQDVGMLTVASRVHARGLFKFIPKIQLAQIWEDTVVQKPKYQKNYPIEIRRMGWEIRSADRYVELGVLGDLCEDANLMEEADHFHSQDCLHTYGCRWLFNICRGMDGR